MKGWFSVMFSILLAIGVTAGAMAHAAEISSDNMTFAGKEPCASDSKKSDDGSSESSKGSLGIHACHGHHVGIPVVSATEAEFVQVIRAMPLRTRASLAPPAPSDTFRPPIA